MAPVVLALGAIAFWIGAFLLVNPHGVPRFWNNSEQTTAQDARLAAWRAVGGVLLVVGIGTILIGAPSV